MWIKNVFDTSKTREAIHDHTIAYDVPRSMALRHPASEHEDAGVSEVREQAKMVP